MTKGTGTPHQINAVLRAVLKLPVLLHRVGLGPRLARHNIMMLYTTGRRSGLRRVSGLNYAVDGDTLYAVAGWGPRTDWYQNLLASPGVEVHVGAQRLAARARPISDPTEAAKALSLLRSTDGGPPRPLRPVLRLIGFDYDAERDLLYQDPTRLTLVAMDVAGPIVVPSPRSTMARWAVIPLGLGAIALAAFLLIRRLRRP